MSSRTSLPWGYIIREVRNATIGYVNENGGGHPLVVHVRKLADFVQSNKPFYPSITKGATYRSLCGRISMAMEKDKWTRWTTKAGATGRKYVIPWERIEQ